MSRPYIIRQNDTHLIEVERWGYAGDVAAFLADAEAHLAETGLTLGERRSAKVRIGSRLLSYYACPYVRDTPELRAQDLAGLSCQWGHNPDRYGRCVHCGEEGC